MAALIVAALTVVLMALILLPQGEQGEVLADTYPQTVLTGLDGAPVSLEDFLGQPVVLNFWASWCGPCRFEMPALTQMAADRPDIHFVFVNQREGQGAAERFYRQLKLTPHNVLLDPKAALGRAYGVTGLPTTVILDAKGNVTHRYYGALSSVDIANLVFDIVQSQR